jgi:predicted MPP superfamily phosphohydrolase
VRRALCGTAPDEPHIVLSHNPRLFPLLRGRNCLLLTGHTHGGQVHLPLTNFRRRPSDMHFSPWFRGWYRQGQTQMYVSSGVGSVHFPMRFRCPPEVAFFTLRGT